MLDDKLVPVWGHVNRVDISPLENLLSFCLTLVQIYPQLFKLGEALQRPRGIRDELLITSLKADLKVSLLRLEVEADFGEIFD